jgi:hypothetical protein
MSLSNDWQGPVGLSAVKKDIKRMVERVDAVTDWRRDFLMS